MPLGLNNLPSYFWRVINLILRYLIDICIRAFLDDKLIFSHVDRKNGEHVCPIFKRLSQTKFYDKQPKYELFLSKIEFLDHKVSANGV